MKKLFFALLMFVSNIQSNNEWFWVKVILGIEVIATLKVLDMKKYEIFGNMLIGKNFTQARLMLRLGIVSIKNNSNFFTVALHNAVCRSDETVVEFLLENGVDVNAKNTESQGETAMHCAMQCREIVRMVQLLLDRGADIDSQDYYKSTPLLWVIYRGGGFSQNKNVALLLKHKANIFLRNNLEMSALDIVKKDSKSLDIMRKADAICLMPLLEEAERAEYEKTVTAFSHLRSIKVGPKTLKMPLSLTSRIFQMIMPVQSSKNELNFLK